MKNYKKVILDNHCYTELVYGRIAKKLNIELSKVKIEKLISTVITETDETNFQKTGKNSKNTAKNSEKAPKNRQHNRQKTDRFSPPTGANPAALPTAGAFPETTAPSPVKMPVRAS